MTAEPEIAPEIAAEIAAGAAADPDLDAKAAQQAAQAFGLLIKGLKNIAIYRHAESRYGEYLDPAYRALTQFLGDHQNLPLKLGPYTLEYNKHVIYEEQSKENLTYRFYRDGMRFLVFREGLELDELLRFMLLAIDASSDAQLQQEDMITRLWKESFQHIEYVVVEGFEFGELSQDQVEIEVEKIVGYLRQQLAANSDDITRFARLSVEDLELELNDIEQVRGNIISGRTARDDDRARIQEELFLEEKKRVFAKMVLILFQILERDSVDADYELMAESFAQVLDTLLLSEDVGGSVAVLHRFDQIAQRPTLDAGQRALVARIRENFARRMAEPQRLEAVAQYMTLTQHLDPLAVKAYLSVLDAGAIPMLCDMLEGMERAEARQVLIEVLADIGKDQAGVFAQRLDSKSSNVVRDMLAIIDIIDPPDKISLYGHLLEHPNLMIRLEGLKIMSKSRTEVAIKHLEKAMHDQDIQMRLGAYRALATSHPARAVPAFKTLMRSETYLNRDRREQLAIAIALGETRAPDALAFFESLFDTRGSLFQRGKVNDLKLMAVRGLAAMRSVDAFKLLTNQLQNRAHGKDLLQEIHKTALWLRGELTGQVQ